MRRILFLVLSLVFHFSGLSAQEKPLPFEISGQINADTGIVRLSLVVDSNYYPKGVLHLNAKVLNGKFLIKGDIPYPLAFYLEYQNVYRSNRLIIEPGLQSISVNIDSIRTTPQVDNLAMKEYRNEYLTAYKDLEAKNLKLDKKRDSLKLKFKNNIPQNIKASMDQDLLDSYAENDRILLQYTAAHPNSYLAFWALANLLDFGYQNIFDPIFSKFSDSIKNTAAGRILQQKLILANVLGEGKKFPDFKCIDSNGQLLTSASLSKNQYTLIDFWYSGCGPCIRIFPELKEIYDKYRGKGFEIIAISVDKEKNKGDMERVINKHKLKWPQYWDVNGVESSRLSINAFPKKFLLNKEGIIINQDLSASKLEDFLLENLK